MRAAEPLSSKPVSTAQHVNVLDRMAKKLLYWDFYADWKIKSRDAILNCRTLPDVFTSSQQYIEMWEPLVIREIQQTIISDIRSNWKSSTLPNESTLVVSPFVETDHIVRIEARCRNILDNNRTEMTPNSLDVVIFSYDPSLVCLQGVATTPQQGDNSGNLASSSLQESSRSLFLGLVANSITKQGTAICQILMLRRDWLKLASEPGSLSQQPPTISKSSVKINNASTSLSIRVPYRIVTNVRSSWREYFALLDVQRLPLKSAIFASEYARMKDQPNLEVNATNLSSADKLNSKQSIPVWERLALCRLQQQYGQEGGIQIMRENSSTVIDPTLPWLPDNSSNRTNVRRKFTLNLEKELALHWKATKRFMAHLKQTHNESQLCAMHDAITSRGFSLIQGPPGTGKTKTIVGLLNGIHLHEHNVHYDELLRLFLDPQQKYLVLLHDLTPKHYLDVMARAVASKPRILVVAPSNVAVDHIMERVITEGFLDGHGNIYHPVIMRLGSGQRRKNNQNHSAQNAVISPTQAVTLEHLLQEEISALHLTPQERRAEFDNLTLGLQQCLMEVRNFHALLINLRQNFEICHPLPEGVELRVAVEDGRPFWLNHISQTTSLQPPDMQQQQATNNAKAPVFGYQRYDQLPDYGKYAHLFTQSLTRMKTVHMKRSRLEAIMTSQTARNDHQHQQNHNRQVNSTTNLPSSTASLPFLPPTQTQQRPDIHHTLPQNVREMIESSIISDTHIMFTTLNMCGHASLEATDFTVTVVDEAAQCVETSILIPLRRGCKKCVLVGDQDQLPATVFAEEVKALGYDRSLFQRLIDAGHPYVMLDTQYRMRPEISRFPSLMFYDGLLQDGASVQDMQDCTVPFIRPNVIQHDSTYFTEEEKQHFPTQQSLPSCATTTISTTSSNGSTALMKTEAVAAFQQHPQQPQPLISKRWFMKYLESDVNTVDRSNSSSSSSQIMKRQYIPVLNTVMFFDLQYTTEDRSQQHGQQSSLSKINSEEAQFCIHLIETMILDLQFLKLVLHNNQQVTHRDSNQEPNDSSSAPDGDIQDIVLGTIGIITPYTEQLQELRRQVFASPIIRQSQIFGNIELNTVDGFQGREKDIILISTVRANDEGNIGFVSNKQRMNVAITRAKYGLFVIGQAATLERHGLWYSYLHYCRKMNAVVPIANRTALYDIHTNTNATTSTSMNDGNNPNNSNNDSLERNTKRHKRRRNDYAGQAQYSPHQILTQQDRYSISARLHAMLAEHQQRLGVAIPAQYSVNVHASAIAKRLLPAEEARFPPQNAYQQQHQQAPRFLSSSFSTQYIQPPIATNPPPASFVEQQLPSHTSSQVIRHDIDNSINSAYIENKNGGNVAGIKRPRSDTIELEPNGTNSAKQEEILSLNIPRQCNEQELIYHVEEGEIVDES